MEASDHFKFYLDGARSLQNYLVGFALVQSLAFLYGLEKFGHKIYSVKLYVIIGIAAAVSINWAVLYIAKRYELKLLSFSFKAENANWGHLQMAINTGFWIRGGLITLINGASGAVFYFVAQQSMVC
jgi:hypothetical protein